MRQSSFHCDYAREFPRDPDDQEKQDNGHKKHKRHKKGSKANQGVKKRPQYGWNCGAARNHSVGRRIQFFSFCVSVPFVVFAFDEFVFMCILWQIDCLQDDFPYLESRCAEIDNHSILKSGCTEITQRLSDMFRGQSPGSFEFNYKAVLDEQIREEAAEERTVFIAYQERLLLLNE